MQRLSAKGPSSKDLRTNKLAAVTSKHKKQTKVSSSKNLKTLKTISNKPSQLPGEFKIKQNTSPDHAAQLADADNDYGVNPYYNRYKVKTSQKKEPEVVENTDYGTFNTSKDMLNSSHFDSKNEKGSAIKEESDYAESAFQKIKLPNPRGLINAEGKFVAVKRQKQQKNHSFHHNSGSKHSFSLNFTSRQDSKYKKRTGKSKSKSKNKMLEAERSREYKHQSKSMDKNRSKEHNHSYYDKSRQERKPKPERKIKARQHQECDKIASINSKATSIGTDAAEIYETLCLTQDSVFVDAVKDQITSEINKHSSLTGKSKLSQAILKERNRFLLMMSRICGMMNIKRQAFYLALNYLDNYIAQFPFQSLKLMGLGCLTLALKMDDAEMISKFCFSYLYNPEKTVKKSGSSKYIKIKQKRESVVTGKEEARQMRSKLANIVSAKIAEEKRIVKEDFTLEQILDCQTQIMLRFGFKLALKTINYWVDMLTALWDSYVAEFSPKYLDTLTFRDERTPRNISYLLQLVELQSLSRGIYAHSKVVAALAGIYLVARMALQEKKEQTPWDELCRYYRMSLSKTTNLIFCDGVGINILFGDFLTLFELNMTNIIECVQMFSRYLQPELLKVYDYRKVEGLNREDRLGIHIHSDELYRYHGT